MKHEIINKFISAYFNRLVEFILNNQLQFEGRTAEETAWEIIKGGNNV